MTTPGTWEVTEKRGAEALSAFLPEWHALETHGAVRTPFQSPEWLLPWWKEFRHGELRVLLVRSGNEPRALAPFVVEQCDSGFRVTLLGLGNSDYLDVIDRADDSLSIREAAAYRAVETITGQLGPSDRCEFEQLPPDSMLLRVANPPPWSRQITRCGICPTANLPSSEDELPELVSTDFLRKLRRARRRLGRLGAVRAELATPGNLAELLDKLFALHTIRWNSRGGSGVLMQPAVRRFLTEAAEGFLRRGVLRLHALRVGDRIAAVVYAIAWRGRLYCYASGFDPEFKNYSVGSLVLEDVIRSALREGTRELDFLGGRERYKYRWGASDRETSRVLLEQADFAQGESGRRVA